MKLAFCSEDQTDTQVLHALAQRCVMRPIELVQNDLVLPRQGGWQNALKIAPTLARAIFNSDAHGAVFVVDADGSPTHESHGNTPNRECRQCELLRVTDVVEVQRWPRPALPPLQFIFAVPVQILETWLLLASGRFPHQRQPGSFGASATERRQLKHRLYGSDRPDRSLMLRTALPIAQSVDVSVLRSLSASFGHFSTAINDAASVVAGWIAPPDQA